jgi:excisionase family DNA binding protein
MTTLASLFKRLASKQAEPNGSTSPVLPATSPATFDPGQQEVDPAPVAKLDDYRPKHAYRPTNMRAPYKSKADGLLSTRAAARLLDTTTDSVRRFVREGRLRATRNGTGHLRFARRDLNAFLAKRPKVVDPLADLDGQEGA